MSKHPEVGKADIERLKGGGSWDVLVGLLEEDGHELRPDQNRLECLCPFHQERTPSFKVYPDGKFKCFGGCPEKESAGDAVSYLCKYRGLTFLEALQLLAERDGGAWPENLPRPEGEIKGKKPPAKTKPKRAASKPKRKWTPIVPVPADAPACTGKHFKHGDCSKLWTYRNAKGELLGHTARYDLTKDGERVKEFSWWTWCQADDGERRWCGRAWVGKRPCYRLDQVGDASDIHIFEGEKAADFAQEMDLGAPAVSWPGGSKAVRKAKWDWIAGKRVWIWPDADDSGTTCLHDLVGIFLGLDCQVHVINLDRVASMLGDLLEGLLKDAAGEWLTDGGAYLPKGFDIADLPAAIGRDAVLQLFDDAEQIENWEQVSVVEPPKTLSTDDDEPDQAALHEDCAGFAITDQGNALRMRARWGHNVRYDWTRRQWLVWNGNHWEYNRDGHINRLAMDTVTYIRDEARHQKLMPLDKYVAKSYESQARRRRLSMVEDLATLPGITVSDRDQLDRDAYVLTTPNGTIDLRTGKLRPPRRDDLITCCTAAVYDEHAGHPHFARILQGITGEDKRLQSFLQLAWGMSLVGGNREELIFCMNGNAGTGKSTLVSGIMAALGHGYAMAASMTTFLKSDNDKIRNDIARLDGPRVVVADELRGGMAIDEGTVKWITGRTPVVARFLNAEEFQFTPRFVPWLICNKPPYVRSDDEGMRRRLISIPITNVIAEKDKDPRIKDSMLDTTVCGPAILAWLVRGAMRYLNDGWELPGFVRENTRDYFESMDPMGGFLREWTIQGNDPDTVTPGIVGTKYLRRLYEKYCRDESEMDPMRNKPFKERIKATGAEETTVSWHPPGTSVAAKKKTKVWRGLCAHPEAPIVRLTENAEPGTDGTGSQSSTATAPKSSTCAHTRARVSENPSLDLKEEEPVPPVPGSPETTDEHPDDLAPF